MVGYAIAQIFLPGFETKNNPAAGGIIFYQLFYYVCFKYSKLFTMENLDLLNNDLQVSPQAQSYLTESAKWGKFLAIVGFIFCGFMVVLAFLIPALFSQLSQNSVSEATFGFSSSAKTIMTVVYLILAIFLFFPCLYLYRFSVKMQVATRNVSQENFDDALMNLKSMFKFYGIFTIAILSFYALIIIVSIIGAAMR